MRMGVGRKRRRQSSVKRASAAVKVHAMIQESDVEQWLAIRKEAGLKINPKTAEVEWRHALTLDPYGVYPDLPEECQQVGRQYFARIPRKRHMGPLSTTCRRRPSMCGRREPQQHEIRRAAALRAGKFH